ncbi:unnamed protein product [Adineta ricciae]|uniref:Uncharacterized protein n=1 Tax=Adineta ricciae TaxID=249248 RepID=A0A814Y4U4_ADIRI|nr:unnamed protein product [Adineta ricciae]CAF1390909.1 unnamed protein product [Adineta ricciae]
MWKILFVILILWINFSLARPSAEQPTSEIDLYKPKTFIQDLLDRSKSKHRQAASCQRCLNNSSHSFSTCRLICDSQTRSPEETGRHRLRQYHDR